MPRVAASLGTSWLTNSFAPRAPQPQDGMDKAADDALEALLLAKQQKVAGEFGGA